MGGCFSSCGFASVRANGIVIVGLDAAGKTTWLYRLQKGAFSPSLPTIVSNFEEVEYKKVKFSIWDLGGQTRHRPLWKYHYQGTKGLLFVVDSSDKLRMQEARQELQVLLKDPHLQDAVLVVLANKQDVVNSMTAKEVAEALTLPKIASARSWYVQPTSALCGEGTHEAMDWIISHITVDRPKANDVHYPEKNLQCAEEWRRKQAVDRERESEEERVREEEGRAALLHGSGGEDGYGQSVGRDRSMTSSEADLTSAEPTRVQSPSEREAHAWAGAKDVSLPSPGQMLHNMSGGIQEGHSQLSAAVVTSPEEAPHRRDSPSPHTPNHSKPAALAYSLQESPPRDTPASATGSPVPTSYTLHESPPRHVAAHTAHSTPSPKHTQSVQPTVILRSPSPRHTHPSQPTVFLDGVILEGAQPHTHLAGERTPLTKAQLMALVMRGTRDHTTRGPLIAMINSGSIRSKADLRGRGVDVDFYAFQSPDKYSSTPDSAHTRPLGSPQHFVRQDSGSQQFLRQDSGSSGSGHNRWIPKDGHGWQHMDGHGGYGYGAPQQAYGGQGDDFAARHVRSPGVSRERDVHAYKGYAGYQDIPYQDIPSEDGSMHSSLNGSMTALSCHVQAGTRNV